MQEQAHERAKGPAICGASREVRGDAPRAVDEPADRCRASSEHHEAFAAGGGSEEATEQQIALTDQLAPRNRPRCGPGGDERVRHLQKIEAECIGTRQCMAGVDGVRRPTKAVRASESQ